METNQSPLLVKYLKNHLNNPGSKAFAPLAEAYRKIGQVEKALELLRAGLKLHPNYISALATLGKCHMDLGRHDLAYTSLKPVMDNNIDNILLLKVFAEACEKTNRSIEALQSYKYLLFLNPRDEFYRGKVTEYEGLEANKLLNESSEESNSIEADELKPVFEHKDVDQWETQNFFGLQAVKDDQSIEDKNEKVTNPVMTMTLVDLYMEQGIYAKAEEALSHILKLQPDNFEAKARWKKLGERKSEGATDEGRSDLMNIIDQKFAKSISDDLKKAAASSEPTSGNSPAPIKENSVYLRIEQKYNDFMQGVTKRSQLIS